MLAQVPDTKFIFLGRNDRGPWRKETMKDVLLRNLKGHESHIEFIDQVSLPEVYRLLEQTKVCVFPSLWENFPNVCLEAMAAGKGIVASRSGGMKEMLEPVNGGVLINPHNVAELADAITTLLLDDTKRNAMGERSRKRVVDYYAQALPEQLITLYKSFTRERKVQ